MVREVYGSSEAAIAEREFIEEERTFAYKMATLDGLYRKGMLAAVMGDIPPMTMVDVDAVFQNVQLLHKAADEFYKAVVTASAGAKFFVETLAALKSTKYADVLGKFLSGAANAQMVLYNRLFNAPKKEARTQESLQQWLDATQHSKRANGATLSDLLSAPYQHLGNQKRMFDRIATLTKDAEKEAVVALRAALDAVKVDTGSGDQDSKAVQKSLKWQSKMVQNDFNAMSLIDGEHRLLRIGAFGVKIANAKKAKSHDAYLFHDALLLCDKKKVLVALDLSRAFDVSVRATSPAAFAITSRNTLNGATFFCECVCTARCDALNWADDITAAVNGNKRQTRR